MQGFPQVMSLLVNTQAFSHVAQQALNAELAVSTSLWSETLRRAKAIAVSLLLLSEAWP